MFKSKPFLIFLILWSFVFAKDTSAANPQSQADIAILIPVIERELTKAKAELDLNKQSSASAIKELKDKLDEIWSDIKTQGYSEKVGIDRIRQKAERHRESHPPWERRPSRPRGYSKECKQET